MNGLRVGRLFGFEIRIDFSWFILFFLIVWSFSAMVFPRQAPGFGPAVYPAMGVAGALLFFASLLAHELAHSLVARVKNIPVDGITLFLFGGMAHTRTEAETPGDEFQIAAAGPLMSVFVSVLLGAVWYVGLGAGWSMAVLAVLQYVAVLNLILAVFNLLPGFPLDGGRVFRAAVWKATGSAERATRVAATGGRWIGYALVGLGLLSAFTGNVLGGMWLVFIGWFLRNAAISSYRQHLLLAALTGVRASEAMTRDPVTVDADETVRELMEQRFMRERWAGYPVVDRGRVAGLVTLHATREVPREEWDIRVARDIMTRAEEAGVVRPDDHMMTVMDRLRGAPGRRVLVMRGSELCGIITAGDLGFWLERARLGGTLRDV